MGHQGPVDTVTSGAGGAGQPSAAAFGWISILRLGLVQTALGAIVILTTSTLNRVMVVELALPAMLPGALVALHYAVQMLRPRWGHGSDQGGRRTPWIIGGMAVLGLGGLLAAVATALMATSVPLGIALATFAFLLIGAGVGAAGTSMLILLATGVAPERRAAAASIVWIMMIAGFVVTTITAAGLLEPFTLSRLVTVVGGISLAAVLLATIAVTGLERRLLASGARTEEKPAAKTPFREALAEVWDEPLARRFTIFVFVSMLAYSAQDLILEPFAGIVFGFTPGQSTGLAGIQNMGVLLGMILVAILASVVGGPRLGSLRAWTAGGCAASALALFGLVLAAGMAVQTGRADWPLEANVFALGFSNGVFAVAAIGSMMGLATAGSGERSGVRMGLWGAAQAIAFGMGGFVGALSVDLVKALIGAPTAAYGAVFAAEGLLFVLAAVLALRLGKSPADAARVSPFAAGDGFLAEAGGRS